MKTILLAAVLFAGLLVAGCQGRKPEFERTVLTVNNQRIEILTAFRLFDNYMEKSRPNTNIVSASKKFIYDPVRQEITADAEAAFLFSSIEVPYQPNEYLRAETDRLKSSDLIPIIKEALSKATAELPGPDTKVIVLPASEYMRQSLEKNHLPLSGLTIGAGKIILMIDPTFEDWTDFLPYAIAHEYHHSTWTSRNWISADFSLIEYLVLEGRADVFASDLYGTLSNPLTRILSKQQEAQVWKLIENEIFEKGHERINKVMFGDSLIPFGSGYTIGFNIVKRYKQRNPTLSGLDLIDTDPRIIFEQSGYSESVTETGQYIAPAKRVQ